MFIVLKIDLGLNVIFLTDFKLIDFQVNNIRLNVSLLILSSLSDHCATS